MTEAPSYTQPMLPPGTLLGKTALVTGGGSGLGLAIALEFARLGANVAVAGRRMDVLSAAVTDIEARGANGFPFATDVRSVEAVDALVGATLERFGAIDILVNSAAGNFTVPSIDLSPNGWRAVVDIVLNGTWFCSQRVAKAMIAAGHGGTILNIGTTYASGGNPYTVHSAAAKAGVLAMSETLAVEWAQYGIRVNVLAPGPIADTGAVSQLWPDEEKARRVIENVPLKRLGDRQEVANLAAYLVSDYAAYVTGACLIVDGARRLGKGAFAPPSAPATATSR
jgi:NAD(P)-dependent dehydrogenase (short-subunit alcohol dehydrogenase family)